MTDKLSSYEQFTRIREAGFELPDCITELLNMVRELRKDADAIEFAAKDQERRFANAKKRNTELEGVIAALIERWEGENGEYLGADDCAHELETAFKQLGEQEQDNE